MVLVSTADRRKLYDYLLQEGVFCSRKDNMTNNEILNIPNLHCFLVMRSLRSRKFVTEIFSWQWHYYFLTPEGIKYLREYLGLPSNVIPNTHKADRNLQKNEDGEGEGEGEGEKRGRGRGRGGRGARGGRGRGRGGEAQQQTGGEF